MNRPETQFAMNGDLAVAYQVFGDSGPEVLVVPNFFSNVEACWDVPEMRRWLEELASFARVIIFDQPGTGVSDPISPESPPTLEQWADSARVVVDAAGMQEVTVASVDGGFPIAAMFAATYPTRTKALVAMDAYARQTRDDDYPFGIDPELMVDMTEGGIGLWGTGEVQHSLNWDMPWNDEIRKTWARFERQMASPRSARHMFYLLADVDVRQVLPAIRCPALIIHHAENVVSPLEHGRYIAEHVPNAKLVVVPGRNVYPLFDDWRDLIDEVREFLTGTRSESSHQDRMLATVLFTDIVESTSRAARMGDSGWRALLDAHDAIVRSQLGHFRGREVKTVGDGFFATFDGPQRAIRCALAIRETLKPLGIEVRAGLHTGECEIRGEDVGGIAVHIGARVAAEAAPSEVLVSSTVKDLVVGSGLEFEDRGPRELKGVPGEWRLYAVAS